MFFPCPASPQRTQTDFLSESLDTVPFKRRGHCKDCCFWVLWRRWYLRRRSTQTLQNRQLQSGWGSTLPRPLSKYVGRRRGQETHNTCTLDLKTEPSTRSPRSTVALSDANSSRFFSARFRRPQITLNFHQPKHWSMPDPVGLRSRRSLRPCPRLQAWPCTATPHSPIVLQVPTEALPVKEHP